jgi:hypothetical protein
MNYEWDVINYRKLCNSGVFACNFMLVFTDELVSVLSANNSDSSLGKARQATVLNKVSKRPSIKLIDNPTVLK